MIGNTDQESATGLQREIKQTRPFRSPYEEVYLNLMRTFALVSQPHDAFLKHKGLTPVMYNILRIVNGAGEAGATCTDVARRLLTRVPDVTRLIDRLTARGLVYRERTDRDRRLVLLYASERGKALLEETNEPLHEIVRSALKNMTTGELDSLNRLLVKARTQVLRMNATRPATDTCRSAEEFYI